MGVRFYIYLFHVFLLFVLLASCSGSGSKSGVSPISSPVAMPAPSPVAMPAPSPMVDDTHLCGRKNIQSVPLADLEIETEEYNRQWGLAMVCASALYTRLFARDGADVAAGEGVRVGVFDTGLPAPHWEFNQEKVEEEDPQVFNPDDGLNSISLFQNTERAGDASHGTMVASVIVADRNSDYTSIHFDNFVDRITDEVERERAREPLRTFWRSNNFHGLAWGAEARVFPIPLGSATSAPYDPISLEELRQIGAADSDDTVRFRHLLKDNPYGLDILNMSFGISTLVSEFTAAQVREAMGSFIEVLAQGDAAEKILLVWSAGNINGKDCGDLVHPYCVRSGEANRLEARDPTIWSGLTAYVPELRSHMVTAVAIRANGEIASFSNRCGLAAISCIAAPGHSIWVAVVDSPGSMLGDYGYTRTSGTSFSAPMVSGSLALLKHYFRGMMNNEELLSRLYETANKTGLYAPDDVESGQMCPAHLDIDGDRTACELSSVYGQGLVDLDEASSPQGQTMILTGSSLDDVAGSYRVDESLLAVSGAFGDAFSRVMAGREVAFFDSLGAPFWLELSGLVEPMRGSPLLLSGGGGVLERGELWWDMYRIGFEVGLGRAVDMYGGGWGGRDEGDWRLMGEGMGHAGLTRNSAQVGLEYGGLRLVGFHHILGDEDVLAVRGGLLSWRVFEDLFSGLSLSLSAGVVDEGGSLFHSRGFEAFGGLSAVTQFVGLRLGGLLWGWDWMVEGELGYIDARSGGGLIEDFSGVRSSAFGFHARRSLSADGMELRLSVAQPLRIESGEVGFRVPMGRTKAGGLVYEDVRGGLSPSGRQVDFGVGVYVPLWAGGLETGVVMSRQAYHEADRDLSFRLLATYRHHF